MSYPWSESAVAEMLGVSRGELAGWRKKMLMADEDFVNRPGKGIFYSEDGKIKAAGGFGVRGQCVDVGSEEKTPPAKAEPGYGAYLVGRVIRIWPGRKWLLTVRMEEDRKEALVRVRNNRKFVIGQRLPLVPRDPFGRMFYLKCREPLRRGKLAWVEGGEG